ncbi:MAG: glycosyltransferase family 4 protein [bacterium]|nr:glycosyltransferase family 4 protein [bacterium]
MKRILFVDISPLRGGAEVSLEKILERLGSGEEIFVMVPRSKSGLLNFKSAEAIREDIPLRVLADTKASLSSIFSAAFLFFKGMSIRCGQDIVVTNTFKSHILGLGIKARNRGTKWVIYDRDVPENIFIRLLKKMLYIKSDYVIFNSLFLKRECKDPLNSEVVYNIIDIPEIRGERNFSKILFAGNLTYEKGFDRTLQVFGEFRKRVKNARLVAAGDEGYGHPVRHGSEEDVEFIGYDIKGEYLRDAGFIILLNRRKESFSRAVAEAMLSGAVAVIMKGNGMDDYANNGNSLCFEEYDAERIADRMADAFKSGEAHEIAERGRESVKRLLDADSTVRRLREIFERIIL